MHREEQGVFQNVGSWKLCRILRNLCSATHCRGAFCDQVLKSVIHLPCIPFPYFRGSVTVIRLGSSCRSYVSRISESLVKSWSPTINVSLLPTITLLPWGTKAIGKSGSPTDALHLTSALKNATLCLFLTAGIFINLRNVYWDCFCKIAVLEPFF